ncbi:MAG TPA: hypothetical protein VHK65_15065 [Candidatus Dormibacteraeota bacterium]|nr:hypothetical protein [Candidatus Dormibacteraeota bacterium]
MAVGGKRPGRVLMIAAAALLCVGSGVAVGRLPAWGQLVKAPVSASSSQASNHHAAAPVQGITVHGWWTINVLDRSGRLVASRQLENALTTGSYSGDQVLALLLTRQRSMGAWELLAYYANSASAVVLSNATDDLGLNGPLDVSGATPGHVILSGSYTAQADISFNKVLTGMYPCQASTAPATCLFASTGIYSSFTSTILSPQVLVSNGQIVQFKVDISFS